MNITTLETVISLWLESKKHTVKRSTIGKYKDVAGRFCSSLNKTEAEEISDFSVNTYIDNLQKVLSPVSEKSVITVIKEILNFASENHFVIKNIEELKQHCCFFEKVLRTTQNAFMLHRCAMNVNAFIHACDSLIGISMLSKIALIGVPVCLSSRHTLTAKNVLDIKDVVTDHAVMQKPMAFVKQYRKSATYCRNCTCRSSCFGFMTDGSFSKLYPSERKVSYHSIYDLVCTIFPQKKIRTGILEFVPRRFNDYPIGLETLKTMQDCRLNRNFDGPDFFYIWDFNESCYFNRFMEENDIFTEDVRGLMGMNWQFIGKGIKELEWKQKCDLLLPQNGFNTTVNIKFDSSWTPERQKALDELTFSTIIRVVKEHGGDGHIQQIGNDLLYDGKKFAGKEWLFIQNVGYIENTVVTCEYEPERQWFEKLYHHPNEKQITGITDELPSVTKELPIRTLSKESDQLLENKRDIHHHSFIDDCKPN